MTFTADNGPDYATASTAHLGAIVGPIIPLVIYYSARERDAFAAREAAKAIRFSAVTLAAFVVATLVRLLVPLVGFLGTLAQWVIPIVAIYFCVAAFRLARQGEPANYPFQFKVEKTDD